LPRATKTGLSKLLSAIARTADEVVAVSRVSEELLDVLGVPLGNFVRADGQPPETVIEA
jgi:hypothetical protein